MKNIYKLMMALLTAIVTLSACSVDNEPFITADENSEPRILNTDIAEGKGGKPSALPNISRDANFTFEVTVTPAEYTTVYWYIDGEEVCQGTKIDVPVLAGEHDVKIVARTTQGKEAVRNCTLKVLPLEGDPSIKGSAKNIYCQTGTTKTIEGADLNDIVKVIIGGKEAAATSNGASITFEVPQLEEGEYNLVVVAADGMKYGCGKVTVSAEEWVDPGVSENIVWEGESATLAWNAWEDLKDTWAEAGIGVGATVIVYVSAEEGAQGAITTSWWNDINTGKQWEEAGLKTDLSGDCTMEYTVETTDFLTEQGFAVVGNGFKVTKVVVRTVANVAKVIWEGESATLAWNAWEDLKDSWADAGIAVGKKITVYVSAEEGAQGAITTSWWNDINTGKQWEEAGLKTDLSGDCTMEYTVETTDFLAEQGFAVVGNGFKVKKVTVE